MSEDMYDNASGGASGGTISSLRETNDWLLYAQGRARQKTAGIMAGIFLLLTFIVLADGLVARMIDGGSYRLEMLAGSSEPVSGPVGSGKPTEDQMQAFPIPVDAPVSFEFSGFFTSYWFGTGMWRGYVHVPETAPSGVYELAVGVEGQPSSTFQTYTISVARSVEEQNSQAVSNVRRYTGLNPFYVAAFFAVLGIGSALGNFFLGLRGSKLLKSMGLAEIFKVQPEGDFVRVFSVTGRKETGGKAFVCYDSELKRLGKVIFDKEKGGITECLFVKGEAEEPAKGSLIEFWEPEHFERTPMRKGPIGSLLGRGGSSRGASSEAKHDASHDAQPDGPDLPDAGSDRDVQAGKPQA